MPQHFLRRFIFVASLFSSQFSVSRAEALKISSSPPGATVELNGVILGTTPVEESLPGGYFHRTHTVFGERLEHPMIARESLAG